MIKRYNLFALLIYTFPQINISGFTISLFLIYFSLKSTKFININMFNKGLFLSLISLVGAIIFIIILKNDTSFVFTLVKALIFTSISFYFVRYFVKRPDEDFINFLVVLPFFALAAFPNKIFITC